jgi:hypothetical protein
MATLWGDHRQCSTGRSFRYWVQYGQLSDAEAFYVGAISELSRGAFGGLERGSTCEGSVPTGPGCVPLELAIRSRVMSYIERTDFGEWRPPPPSWPGWYGQML